MKRFTARKPLSLLLEEMEGDNRLRRVLGPLSLTSLGIGCIIGAGIFVITGQVAHDQTGPSLIFSFIVSGIACVFAALSYAEFASMAPVAGSAYTYAYATLGELFAWIIGWDLVLEYTVASATVASSWSAHAREFLSVHNIHFPVQLSTAPIELSKNTGHLIHNFHHFDLLGALIALFLTVVLVKGIKESASTNTAIVIFKVAIVLFVIAVGAFYVNTKNWIPFAPHGYAGVSFFGHTLWGVTGKDGMPLGMLAGAAMVFFAYIGFDSVSTHAEEAKNPQRDVPLGIMVSLLVCTVLYVAVAAVLTGMVPYGQINPDAPIASAFRQVGLPWADSLVSLGALAGLTSVILVLMLSQSRVLLAMARDGLLPEKFFGAVHERFRTPWKSTIVTGAMVAVMACFLHRQLLTELVNIGTLLAFVIVCLAVLVMRRTHPDAERPFRCPLVPLVPICGVGMCVMLMCALPAATWERLIIWLLTGFVIYFSYSHRHSVMTKRRLAAKAAEQPDK